MSVLDAVRVASARATVPDGINGEILQPRRIELVRLRQRCRGMSLL